MVDEHRVTLNCVFWNEDIHIRLIAKQTVLRGDFSQFEIVARPMKQANPQAERCRCRNVALVAAPRAAEKAQVRDDDEVINWIALPVFRRQSGRNWKRCFDVGPRY